MIILIVKQNSKNMKKVILMLVMVMPMTLIAQNRAPENKVDRPIIENKPYKYEYVIIRGIIELKLLIDKNRFHQKKKAKKDETSSIHMSDVKGYMKHIQKSRWAIHSILVEQNLKKHN